MDCYFYWFSNFSTLTKQRIYWLTMAEWRTPLNKYCSVLPGFLVAGGVQNEEKHSGKTLNCWEQLGQLWLTQLFFPKGHMGGKGSKTNSYSSCFSDKAFLTLWWRELEQRWDLFFIAWITMYLPLADKRKLKLSNLQSKLQSQVLKRWYHLGGSEEEKGAQLSGK